LLNILLFFPLISIKKAQDFIFAHDLKTGQVVVTEIIPRTSRSSALASNYFGVKEALFPFKMFPEVDPVLGPEMRSTGEILGHADSFGLAYYKAQLAARQKLHTEATNGTHRLRR
jgi:carbamoylphosphate synthase large subunit